jgi:hypothetical protein
MDETTTKELTDDDIRTVMPGTVTKAETEPKDMGDGDGTDGDGTDGKDGDAGDMGDTDGTDGGGMTDMDGTDTTS